MFDLPIQAILLLQFEKAAIRMSSLTWISLELPRHNISRQPTDKILREKAITAYETATILQRKSIRQTVLHSRDVRNENDLYTTID